jgi:hypothetical protein
LFLNRSITMSSEMDFVASLIQAQIYLYKIGGPILMGFGTVSCILSLIIFTKKTLRKNPCSVYLVAANVSNFLLIYTSIISTTLSNGYSIDPSAYNLIYCRFRIYAMLLFDVLSPSYLILASVDRVLITSSNAFTRQRSTLRLAYICIITVTLFWMLAHSHALIVTNIIQLTTDFSFCYFQPGIQLILMGYYSIIIKGILVPLLMLILGLWAIKNVQRASRLRLAPAVIPSATTTVGGLRSPHSKDRLLLLILFIDIAVYIIFSLMISIVLMYQQIALVQSSNFVEVERQSFLLNVGVFSTYIPFCVGCYTNLLVSKTFRHEFKNVFMCR